MSTNSMHWSRGMTVKLRDNNGSETTLHLSMATVVAYTTTLVVAILSGLIIWIFALQATVSTHEAKIAVMTQVDTDHKSSLEELKLDIKELKPVIFDIRQDQIRREKREK